MVLIEKRTQVSVLLQVSPPSLTSEKYDAILARQYEAGIQPAPGRELEVCFGSGDKMKVSCLFDLREKCDAFGAHLAPILQKMNLDPGEPEVFEVHNIINRTS